MICFDLLIGFLKVGLFAFGGAYGAIPLIRDVVLTCGWLSDDMLTYMIAVSESTPGPIMVNLATYVGSSQAGIWGALIATTAVVLPSFVIILLNHGPAKEAAQKPICTSAPQGAKAMYYRYHLRHGYIHDPAALFRERQRAFGKHDSYYPDHRPRRYILWLKKSSEERHFTDCPDSHFRFGWYYCLSLITVLSQGRIPYMLKR